MVAEDPTPTKAVGKAWSFSLPVLHLLKGMMGGYPINGCPKTNLPLPTELGLKRDFLVYIVKN